MNEHFSDCLSSQKFSKVIKLRISDVGPFVKSLYLFIDLIHYAGLVEPKAIELDLHH